MINKLKISNTKKVVIPPTYSLEKISKNKIKSTEKSEVTSLLTICRLEKRKCILPALRCLSYLNENKPRIDPNYSFDLCRLGCSLFDYFIDDLDDIKKLKSTLSKFKGSSPVYFDIHDSKNEFKLNMISEDTKVNISKELLISLEEDEFLYKLN